MSGHRSTEDEYRERLNVALARMVGKRVTLFNIDWRVGFSCTDPDAGHGVIIETSFTIGPPGAEQMVVPGEYGPSIASVIGLLGETVTAAVVEPGLLDLRLSFSNGSRLAIVREVPGTNGPHSAEWEYFDGSGPGGHFILYD